MPGYPLIPFFPAFSVQGYTGIPGTTGSMLSFGTANYFSSYAPSTIFLMNFAAKSAVATNLTFQPFGAVTGSAAPSSLGTPMTISVAANLNFIQYSVPQNINLTLNGYMGILVSSTVSTQVSINAVLWAAQSS